nr:MAG TPA: helix-turn-helix domain protein [Caudoviricetes sp.]
MKNLQMAETHVGHGVSQFKLTDRLLKNLNKYELSPTGKLVLLYLSSCYNPKKADVFPKQKTIANKLGISERSVVRAIQELVKGGLIFVESKYTNHYVLSSKIVQKPSQNEKFFEPENLSDDLSQNDTSKRDNLSPHEHEPKKEQEKQPLSMEDYKILKQYATKRGAKNIQAYINALIKLGSAESIIKEYKQIQANAQGMLAKAQKVQEDLKFARANRAENVPSDFFEKVKSQIKSSVE